MRQPFKVTITWISSNNPDSIWNRLAAKLGREPTREEAAEEVKRILRSVRYQKEQ